jgi:hypothetical protein
MRSLRSANSRELSDAVINVAALPRDALAQGAMGEAPQVVMVTAPSLELAATLVSGEEPWVRSFRVERCSASPEQRAAVRDLPWETVSVVDPQGPQFCVNNHPQEKIKESEDEPAEPDDEPQEPEQDPEAPEEGDESQEEAHAGQGDPDFWVDDFVTVRVPRSGHVAHLLRHGEPPCMAGTSPTINCLTLYWLSRSHDPSDGEVRAAIGERGLPCRYQAQHLRRSLSAAARLDVQVNSVQVPLAAIAVAAGRQDLLPRVEPELLEAS